MKSDVPCSAARMERDAGRRGSGMTFGRAAMLSEGWRIALGLRVQGPTPRGDTPGGHGGSHEGLPAATRGEWSRDLTIWPRPVDARCLSGPRVVDRAGIIAGRARLAQWLSTKELPGVMQLEEEISPRAMQCGRWMTVS